MLLLRLQYSHESGTLFTLLPVSHLGFATLDWVIAPTWLSAADICYSFVHVCLTMHWLHLMLLTHLKA